MAEPMIKPFVDEQKGEATLGHIVFEDGVLIFEDDYLFF